VPEQIATSLPAFATGVVLTVTTTASVEVQVPFATVTVYVVVDAGLATGLAIAALLNPVLGLHEYVVPPLAPNVVELPEQKLTSAPAFATGVGVTVTTTASVEEQVPFDAVTVYVIVVLGEATGFAMFVALNPVAGNHVYVVPPEADKFVLVPEQIAASAPAFAVGEGFTVTTTTSVEVHEPFATVTV